MYFLLDEPTNHLDLESITAVMMVLNHLKVLSSLLLMTSNLSTRLQTVLSI